MATYKRRRLRETFWQLSVLLWIASANADIHLPAVISDHMVLRRSERVPIWGRAEPGENVAIVLGNQTAATRTGEDGRWTVSLDLSREDSGPFVMTVEGKNKISINDVLLGEVWLASGQSNMEWILGKTTGAKDEIAQSFNPLFRVFKVKENATRTPMNDVQGEWKIASPQTSPLFSAVGYYFAKRLQKELQIPVGVLDASKGGSVAEAWTSQQALDSVPDLKSARERIWNEQDAFSNSRSSYIKMMGEWTKKYLREDRGLENTALQTILESSDQDWGIVKLPGTVKGENLPSTGIIWLRKEFSCLEDVSAALPIILPVTGFLDVYLNGIKIKSVGIGDIQPIDKPIRIDTAELGSARLQRGKNTLALRLYNPFAPTVFSSRPKAGRLSLEGDWQAKSEIAFSEPTAAMLTELPSAPLLPALPSKTASLLYNGMIHPLIPYAISGVIWYQGEHNAERAWQYRSTFPLLISDWRKNWNQGDFPFYFCQLANYNAKQRFPGESNWAELREAQASALALPNTGQAVLIDIGEAGDPHPRNKKNVGDRLAAIALAKLYKKEAPFCSPLYRSMTVNANKIAVTFAHTEGGLLARPIGPVYDVISSSGQTAPLVRNSPRSEVEGFAICGADKKWVWAEARISGDQVIVWSDRIPEPIAVRYGWADNPTCNLYNGAGFPASPFRTDDFPTSTLDAKY